MTPTEAVAEAMASQDGKTALFHAEKGLGFDGMLPPHTGTYEGYMEDAKSLIERIGVRGFKLVAADV